MIKIIKFEPSNRFNKRFMITLNNNKKINFGNKGSLTFIDHNNEKLKANYIKRHINNPYEKDLINNMIISPSLFSLFILWGKYNDINKNIDHFNNIINKYNKFDYKLLY